MSRRWFGVALLAAAPALVAANTVKLRSDPAKAVTAAAPDEAVVVVVMGHVKWAGDHILVWQRYDVVTHTLVTPARDDKRITGMTLEYPSKALGAKDSDQVAYVGVVPPGDYVLLGHHTVDNKTNSFCFGAPVFHVTAGTVSYLGTYRGYTQAHLVNKAQRTALAWEGDLAKAKATVRGGFPALADRLVAAPIENGATFACSGDRMWAYRVPGAPELPAAAASGR